MADYNREAKRRAKEARMDDTEKPMGKTRPKKRPDIVDLTPEAERYESETAQTFADGGAVKARGMKPAQMSGRGGCKNF